MTSVVKKIKICLLMVVLCFSFSGCNQDDFDIDSYAKTDEGGILISPQEFSGYLIETKLTIKNWKEYLEICENESGIYGLYGKNPKYAISQFCGENAKIQLKNLKTKQVFEYELGAGLIAEIEESYDVKDFECVDISGSILTAQIPKELWQKANPKALWELSKDGISVIYVGEPNGYTWFIEEFRAGTDLQTYYESK